MKIKGMILVLFLASITLMSCDSNSVRLCKMKYKEYLRKTLKDPSSLKIYSETVTNDKAFSATVVVSYGANNSYGASVRSTTKFEFYGYKLYADGEQIR
jgi:hypothetical protein